MQGYAGQTNEVGTEKFYDREMSPEDTTAFWIERATKFDLDAALVEIDSLWEMVKDRPCMEDRGLECYLACRHALGGVDFFDAEQNDALDHYLRMLDEHAEKHIGPSFPRFRGDVIT